MRLRIERKTGQRPASASYSSGLGPVTKPAFFRKLTPVGTSVGTIAAEVAPHRVQFHHPDAFGVSALAQPDHVRGAYVGRPVAAGQTTEDIARAVDGHRGDRRRAQLARFAAADRQDHGPFRRTRNRAAAAPTMTLLTYFSHHGGRMRSLLDIPRRYVTGSMRNTGQGARQALGLIGRALGELGPTRFISHPPRWVLQPETPAAPDAHPPATTPPSAPARCVCRGRA